MRIAIAAVFLLVTGVGGFCQPNPWYTGAAPADSRRNRRR